MVPTPAPQRAAAELMSVTIPNSFMELLTTAGTARVAAMIARTCWKANMMRWETLGLSLMP